MIHTITIIMTMIAIYDCTMMIVHYSKINQVDSRKMSVKLLRGPFTSSGLTDVECGVECRKLLDCHLYDFDKVNKKCELLTLTCGPPNIQHRQNVYKSNSGNIFIIFGCSYYFVNECQNVHNVILMCYDVILGYRDNN